MRFNSHTINKQRHTPEPERHTLLNPRHLLPLSPTSPILITPFQPRTSPALLPPLDNVEAEDHSSSGVGMKNLLAKYFLEETKFPVNRLVPTSVGRLQRESGVVALKNMILTEVSWTHLRLVSVS